MPKNWYQGKWYCSAFIINYIGKPVSDTRSHSSKTIVVFAVDRSQNSTHPSRPMPLSKELKSSLPCPAPEREHELSAVFTEISPGAPRGYSM